MLGLELIVDDLDRAVEMFTAIIGCSLVHRGPSTFVSGEVAMIDAGAVMITLLHPASSGPGRILAERTPRLTQLVFGTESADALDLVRERATEAGVATAASGAGRFHVTAECAQGALGLAVALSVTAVVDQ